MKQAPPAKDQDDGLVSLSVRVEPEIADRLKIVATAEDRTVAAVLRRLIRNHIDQAVA